MQNTRRPRKPVSAEAIARLATISRQAVIKTLIWQALDQQYLARRSASGKRR